MSALTTRDALAKALYVTADREGQEERARAWSKLVTVRARYYAKADALLASGAVVDAATLADDDALVERTAANRWERPAVSQAEMNAASRWLRAVTTALSERSPR